MNKILFLACILALKLFISSQPVSAQSTTTCDKTDPRNCSDEQICNVSDAKNSSSELYVEAAARGLDCVDKLSQLNKARIELFFKFKDDENLEITEAEMKAALLELALLKRLHDFRGDSLKALEIQKDNLIKQKDSLKTENSNLSRELENLKNAFERQKLISEEVRLKHKDSAELQQLKKEKDELVDLFDNKISTLEKKLKSSNATISQLKNNPFGYRNNGEKIILVCENISALQTNYSNKGFDNYSAAVDSQNSMFVLDDQGLTQFYPANVNSSNRTKDVFSVIKTSFHNLTKRQAYIEAMKVSDRYVKNVVMHRNTSGSWSVQITNAGNNEDQLFQRTYWYECVTLADTFNPAD